MKFTAQIDAQNRIIPLFDSDYEALKKCKKGTELSFEVKQKRNIQFHRKFFALINMVYDNQEVFNNIDHLRKELTIASGFYDTYTNFEGQERKEAKSISFSKMDDIEFSELYSKFCDTVIRVMGWNTEMIEQNIESYL